MPKIQYGDNRSRCPWSVSVPTKNYIIAHLPHHQMAPLVIIEFHLFVLFFLSMTCSFFLIVLKSRASGRNEMHGQCWRYLKILKWDASVCCDCETIQVFTSIWKLQTLQSAPTHFYKDKGYGHYYSDKRSQGTPILDSEFKFPFLLLYFTVSFSSDKAITIWKTPFVVDTTRAPSSNKIYNESTSTPSNITV